MSVTREMIGAAHGIMLQRGDFMLSADLLIKIYEAMRNKEPMENRELLGQCLFEMQNAAIELDRQLTAAQADAKRYRWLVANSYDKEGATQIHLTVHTWEPHSVTGEPTEWSARIRGPAIDMEIDKALAATEPKEIGKMTANEELAREPK